MSPAKIRVVFIGTPDFAVPSLEAILKSGFNVVSIITAPDRKAGRGLKMVASPVKQYGLDKNLKILQPTNLKNEEFIRELKSLKADIQVVIAFRMLPEVVWNMPPMGTINLHASLLPDYRGAAPINRAIMAGETVTGVTTFKLKHAIDTGNILLQKEVPIAEADTAGSLHDKLMRIGADVVVKTLIGLVNGSVTERPQTIASSDRIAPKIYKADCELDWSWKGTQLINQIRGLCPYPTARFKLNDKILKVYQAGFIPGRTSGTIGAVETDNKTYLNVLCSDGAITLKNVQLEGKTRMSIELFLRGYSTSL